MSQSSRGAEQRSPGEQTSAQPIPVPRRPNVLVMLTDDQGWGDLSIHGNTNLATPHIDSLARDGALFERFLACPLCAPTRAEFLTGRYHPRGGVHGVTTGTERLNLDETTIAQSFAAAGYATGLFGKWHNGSQYPYHPRGRGFDEFYGYCSGHWGHYHDHIAERDGEWQRSRGYLTDDLTEHALDFVDRHRAAPFFCYLAFNTPHSPFQVPDRHWDRFRDDPIALRYAGPEHEDLDTTRCALAMVENIDENVGRMLARLDALGLAEDTIVVFFGDNGPNSWRWNGGMKGRKGAVDEGGVRVPCLLRWPGHLPGGQRLTPIAGAIDLLPTLTGLAGVPRVGDKPLDGRDLGPLLRADQADWPDRRIFSRTGNRVSVRTQRWRMDDQGRLHDMQADPGQKRNVAAEQPAVAAELRAALDAWRAELLADTRDDRPFSVGYRAFPRTWLPARDGVADGAIARSSKHPNDSFYTDWTSLADTITWDVEVATDGEYEAIVSYTCRAENIGAELELTCGAASTRARVTEAHDPPLIGAAHDRVPREESYVKDFRPLSLGRLHLAPGRRKLTLRGVEKPGPGLVDVWAVTLVLAD